MRRARRSAPHEPRRTALVRAALAGALVVLAGVLPVPLASAAGSAGVVYAQVTPALPGVHLRIGGALAITDSAGRVQVALSDINNVAKSVTLASTAVDATTSVQLTRVTPQPHTTPHVSTISIGLSVFTRVHLTIDSGTSGVWPSDVRALRLHSLAGQKMTVPVGPDTTVRLMSRRTMLQHGSLHTQVVTWNVDRVITTNGAVAATDRRPFTPGPAVRWQVRMVPVAGTVVVQTLPAVAGVQLDVGRQTLTTGPGGRGTVPIQDLNKAPDQVRLASSVAGDDRVQLIRVSHEPPGAPHQRRLLVALRVSRPVDLEFLDLRGGTVPRSRVGAVRLSEAGRTITLKQPGRPGPVWLPTLAAHNVHNHWKVRRLHYSVQAVFVDGANAVFSGRQQFVARAGEPWRIHLSVFPLSVTVSDALFGQQTSSELQLRLPDGRTLAYEVGTGAPTVIPALARGLYHVKVDAAVIGKGTSVLVSQAGEADLRVVTGLDVALVLGGLLAIAAGLVLVGRATALRTQRRTPGGAT
jgi:hypothetical protein